jgi:sporulation protein YlmC with PRC-barrel domain
MEMDIPMNVEVFCVDGLCGRSTSIVLKPKTEEVTHLVVKENESPHQEILVPVTAVTATTPDSINLRYTRHEMADLQPFVEMDYIQVDIPSPADGIYYMMPYAHPQVETLAVKHEAIPANELAVHRGAWVEATDGLVGRVDEFLVDPESDHITHLVLREGHLWGQKDVTIPISEIEHIEENTVRLKIDKHKIETLPTTPVRRKWL